MDHDFEKIEALLVKKISEFKNELNKEDKTNSAYANQQAIVDKKRLEDVIVGLKEKIEEMKDERKHQFLEDKLSKVEENISKKIQDLQAELKNCCTKETKEDKCGCDGIYKAVDEKFITLYDAIKAIEKKISGKDQNQLRPDDNTSIPE